MKKLRLGPIADEKPVRLSVELPAAVHRDLVEYARLLARENGQGEIAPTKLIPPMLARFMEGDRAFARTKRSRTSSVDPDHG
ncbi:DUF2274 domain-containing protein [Komagataeibacter xylinus]|uniref:DUF2274 domain-containing protein n=1 Tax=Komagataeibacter xylinus TaxID=28448 RepID=UPI00280AE073|nr:DUF2274 domain-containing protein [Komagataeibacter xylinus]